MDNQEQSLYWERTYQVALQEKLIVVGEGSEEHGPRRPDRSVDNDDGRRQFFIEVKSHGLDKDHLPAEERTSIKFDTGEMDQIKEEMVIAEKETEQKALVLLVRKDLLDIEQRHELQQHAKDVGCELFILDLEDVQNSVKVMESILEKGADDTARELRERILADTKPDSGTEADEPTAAEPTAAEPSTDISPVFGLLPPD
jgi:hypothetical protein